MQPQQNNKVPQIDIFGTVFFIVNQPKKTSGKPQVNLKNLKLRSKFFSRVQHE